MFGLGENVRVIRLPDYQDYAALQGGPTEFNLQLLGQLETLNYSTLGPNYRGISICDEITIKHFNLIYITIKRRRF